MQMALVRRHWGGVFYDLLAASPPWRPHGWIDTAKVLIYLIWKHDPMEMARGLLLLPPLTDKPKRDFRAAAERCVRNSDAVAWTVSCKPSVALIRALMSVAPLFGDDQDLLGLEAEESKRREGRSQPTTKSYRVKLKEKGQDLSSRHRWENQCVATSPYYGQLILHHKAEAQGLWGEPNIKAPPQLQPWRASPSHGIARRRIYYT